MVQSAMDNFEGYVDAAGSRVWVSAQGDRPLSLLPMGMGGLAGIWSPL
jgi:hypothetical protein